MPTLPTLCDCEKHKRTTSFIAIRQKIGPLLHQNINKIDRSTFSICKFAFPWKWYLSARSKPKQKLHVALLTFNVCDDLTTAEVSQT